MTTDRFSADVTPAQRGGQPQIEDTRAGSPTLDALCALAGPRGAVLFEADGHHTVVRDLADLDPMAWVP